MKRKAKLETPPVMAAELPPQATVYPIAAPVFTIVPCIVCGSDSRSDATEHLCWVCRRLKISAWRDSEPMPAQE